jgi:hypothetical protein
VGNAAGEEGEPRRGLCAMVMLALHASGLIGTVCELKVQMRQEDGGWHGDTHGFVQVIWVLRTS